MSIRAFILGVAAMVCAVPAVAQQRGTIEFGGFASVASFDNALSLNSGYGGGGRVGAYLDPRWSIEFEDAEMRASRPHGLRDVNVGLLSGRLVAVPIKSGSLSILTGVGAGVSTETNFMHTYGLDVLAGAKFALRENAALRIDGVWDWLANQDWKSYKSLRLGLTVYRRPAKEIETRTVTVTAPPLPPQDSVSAEETRRLRERDAELRALRDSLRNTPPPAPRAPTPAATLETMQALIHFAFDKSVLTDSAKAILDDKVAIFRANPAMTIVILGHTDLIGPSTYNLALGLRRAQAAKAYIVSHGIDASRVVIESKGESDPVTQAPGRAGQAPNRRAIFRLLIEPDVIAKP